MSDKETELPLAETLEQLQKRAKAQSFFVWATLPLALVTLITAFISNAYLFQKVKPLAKQTIEYRLKIAYVNIKQSKDALAEHFKPYHALTERDDVAKLFERSKANANFPVEAEEDLILLIEDYRSALFNLASNIPDSGEWHRYQRDQLRNFIESGKLRVDTLKIMAPKKPQ